MLRFEEAIVALQPLLLRHPDYKQDLVNLYLEASWGGAKGFTTYLTSKAFEVAQVVMLRRGIELSKQESAILEHVFELSAAYRTD